MPSPAHIMDPHWNVVASNLAARLVLGFEQSPFNCLTSFFTNPDQRSRYADWDVVAPRVVAQFRAEMAARPEDPQYARIVDHITARSAAFTELWARHEVRPGGVTVKTLIHPAVGEPHFEATMLQVPEHTELRVVMHTPCLCTDTKTRMERLVVTAEAGRRHTQRGLN
jgi:transcription regulator MmyB-like protein